MPGTQGHSVFGERVKPKCLIGQPTAEVQLEGGVTGSRKELTEGDTGHMMLVPLTVWPLLLWPPPRGILGQTDVWHVRELLVQ